MNVNITFMGNSATLANLLSVERMREETFFVFSIFAEDDLPAEWQNFIRRSDSTTAMLVFPSEGLSYTVTQ